MSTNDATGWGARPEQQAASAGSAGETRGGSNPTASGPRELPEQFGPYRVKSKLGAGGMGSVYLVENTELLRDEALKVPHFDPGDAGGVRERFLREARAAARLEHPNLCPVYHAGVIDGVYFMTMRYLKGMALSRFAGKPIPASRAVEIVLALAKALEYAHNQGIVHRDLKPSNVMLCPGIGPVVLDFGLAKQALQDDKLTRPGTLLGTPAYMPPEQVKGELHVIGPPCDVYALGVILFELLTGTLPFTGTPAEVIGQLLYQPAPAPSSVLPGIDPALDALCDQALAKTPDFRFPSMAAFAAALSDSQRGTSSTQSFPVPPLPPPPMPTRPLTEATERQRLLDMQTVAPPQHTPSPPPPLAAPSPQADTPRSSSEIKMVCPRCNTRFRVKGASQSRRSVACPSCGTPVSLAPEAPTAVLDAIPVDEAPSPPRPSKTGRLSQTELIAKPVHTGKGRGFLIAMLGVGGAIGLGLVAAVFVGVWMWPGGGEKKPLQVIKKTESPEEKQRREAAELYREGMDVFVGLGKEVNNERALALFRQAGDKGHAVGRGRAALLLFLGVGADKNEAEAQRLVAEVLPAVRKGADAGETEAQALYGALLANGLGVGKDEKLSTEWFVRAAEKSHPQAAYNLGSAYANGRGVAKDAVKAVEWYHKAADLGHASAMGDLANSYATGNGITRDDKMAVYWDRKAAERGHALSMANLGFMYANGRGIDKDEIKAVEWYRKAADKGDSYGMNNLAFMYENGYGIGKNEDEALTLYARSAAKGNPLAPQGERRLRLIKSIQGRWQRTGDDLMITRDRYANNGNTYLMTLNANAQPATIDLQGQGAVADRSFTGIFRVEGDTLTVCYVSGTTGRPTTFDSKGSNILEVYTRVR